MVSRHSAQKRCSGSKTRKDEPERALAERGWGNITGAELPGEGVGVGTLQVCGSSAISGAQIVGVVGGGCFPGVSVRTVGPSVTRVSASAVRQIVT